MSEINQIALSRLLQAMSTSSSLSSITDSSNNSSSDFFSILSNSLLSYDYSGNSCTSCSSTENLLNSITNLNNNSLYSSDLSSLATLLGCINSNRINVNVGTTNTVENIEISVEDSEKTESLSNSISETKMDKAIELLKEQVGKKYVWAASGPDTFDCSGLTQYIYKEALGKDIPRVSYAQSEYGKAIDKEDLQVGDLVFFDTMNKGRVSHVGMYIGNNQFIHASNSKDGVKISTLSGYYEKTYMGARRP